jgi:hypothetical protein
MADLLLIRPAQGLVVLDPDSGKPLPPEGALKPDTTFWRRRLAAGSVERVEEVAQEITQPEELDDEHFV